MTLTILQHNTRGWKSNSIPLSNIYNDIDADILLLNETSILQHERLKIFNYDCHHTNKDNRRHTGTAIAVRNNITYKLLDNFESDMLGITVETRQGKVTIATLYSPPKAPHINPIDFNRLFNRPEPVYFLGDLNARHRLFQYSSNDNPVGNNIATFLNLGKCQHVGPDFPTLIRHNSNTRPDIVLTNNHVFHNLHLRPGPITTSDHIPIIATISSEPIRIQIKPRKSFHKADWTGYKTDLLDFPIPTDSNPTLEHIDDCLENWTTAIQNSSDNNIPIITSRTIPSIIEMDRVVTF